MTQEIKEKDMTQMNYTTNEINRNFKIKVYGVVDGKKVNTLIGVKGLVNLVNDMAIVNRLLDRAFNSPADKEVCKLRRGIRITFYYY